MMYISVNKERCVQLAVYMIETNSTVRETAKKFGISKSTVHKDRFRQKRAPVFN